MKKSFIILVLLLSAIVLSAQEQQVVPYTLADRDRLSRVESELKILNTKISSLEDQMNVKFDAVYERFESIDERFESIDERFETINERFDSVNSRIDTGNKSIHSRIDSLFWMMGIIAAFMIFLLGYTIWDRRTALKPALDKASTAEDKNKSLIIALREYARKHPDLAEILKTHGLL